MAASRQTSGAASRITGAPLQVGRLLISHELAGWMPALQFQNYSFLASRCTGL